MIKQIFISIIFCLIFISCGDDEVLIGFEFGSEHEFQLNTQNTSIDGSLRFKLSEMQDSRCPEGATCVWQGEAQFKVIVEIPAKDTLELSTYDKATGSLQNFNYELVRVNPYPSLGSEIKTEDYRVCLIIRD